MPKGKVSSPILGKRLRDIRKANGVKSTQSLVPLMKGKYNYSGISRRETGDIPIDFEYLKDFCAALKLSAAEQEILMSSARVNMLRPSSKYSDLVSEWGKIVLNAKVYYSYMPHVVSHYLQTFNYAYSIVSAHENISNPQEYAQARIENAERVLRDPSRLIRILCHENALYFTVGNVKVMVEQLEKLLNFKDEPNIEFRILPRETEVAILVQFGFNIVDDIYTVCENRLDMSITDDPLVHLRFQSDFDTLWSNAVIGVRRNDVLHRAIKYYKSL